MKTERRPKLLHFRASPGELQVLEMMSLKEDISLSEMMRISLREAAEKRGFNSIGLIEFFDEPGGNE